MHYNDQYLSVVYISPYLGIGNLYHLIFSNTHSTSRVSNKFIEWNLQNLFVLLKLIDWYIYHLDLKKMFFRQSFWQYNINHGKALNKICYGASSIICISDNHCRDREREIGRKRFQLKEMSAFEVVYFIVKCITLKKPTSLSNIEQQGLVVWCYNSLVTAGKNDV